MITLVTLFEKFFSKKYPVLILWILLGFRMTYTHIATHSINNYLIFKYAFFNALNHINLYTTHAEHYLDTNHYGPIFSLIIAPFAILPAEFQMYLWQLCNILLLFYAIHQLPLDTFKKNLICLICTQEEYISLGEFQTNGAIAALIILSWVYIETKKDFWAAFFIMLGFFVKLYGIVGLAFFFFSRQKLKFIGSLLFWGVVLFVLPMVFFSPEFIVNSYQGWYHSLIEKNAQNALSPYQDVSVMGMVRRITGDHSISTLPFLAGALVLFILPYFKINRYKELQFRLSLLSSVLLFTVLFSTSSEMVTYIIAFTGVGIWFVSLPKPVTKLQIAVFIFALYIGSLFSTDLFPHYLKSNLIKPYALKALPCLVVWLTIISEMLFKKAGNAKTQDNYIPNNAISLTNAI